MKDLYFSYDDETDILRHISLQVNAGEKVCIQGKDSSGKSTLLRIMAGAYCGFKGVFLLDGLPTGNYNLASLRSQTGVLLNHQDIFHGSLRDNILLGNTSISMQSVIDYAAETGLNDFISTLKDGYDTILDPMGKRLPQSVTHKILLVRALVGNPRLLLLEEPWMNLEKDYRRRLIQLLYKLKNTTVVVVTNDEEFAGLCDKLITLEKGTAIVSPVKKTNNYEQQ